LALTISEAAELSGVSRNAVWLAIRRGELTARRTSGSMWLIEEDEPWKRYSDPGRKRKGPKPTTRTRRQEGD